MTFVVQHEELHVSILMDFHQFRIGKHVEKKVIKSSYT